MEINIRLYYHIVETDEIGSMILKEFNKQKLPGEVNFMPLNRLMVGNVQYPKDPVSLLSFFKRAHEILFH